MKHAEFVAAVKLWLGLPFLHTDCWCPKCDQVLDRLCAHATCCMSGGDAVRLHNALRDFVYVKCLEAGLFAEREQENLLPDDPRRRPGDIFIPQWPGGQGVAMDFAVTSPLQLDQLREAASQELAAAVAYEGVKFSDRDTAQKCRDHGVRLLPMVAESLGGWGPEGLQGHRPCPELSYRCATRNCGCGFVRKPQRQAYARSCALSASPCNKRSHGFLLPRGRKGARGVGCGVLSGRFVPPSFSRRVVCRKDCN